MKLTANGLTGQELQDYLIEIDFKVPKKINYVALPSPPRPTIQQGSSQEAIEIWNAWTAEWRAVKAENRIRKEAYWKQFTDFAAYLASIFDPQTVYTWLQLSERLIGKYGKPISKPIYFICFKDF